MSIATEIQRLQTAKADLKTAIELKGVEVAEADTIDTYASKVEAIKSGTLQINDYRYLCFNGYRLDLIPKLDTSNGTNFYSMFYKCKNSTIPPLDTSNGTDFTSMFEQCENVDIPLLDTSNGTNFYSMFYKCKNSTIPPLDTSKGTNFRGAFREVNVSSIPTLDVSNGTDFYKAFEDCSNLEQISFTGVIKVDISFLFSPLTLESAISVITHLENYAGTEKEFAYTVTFSATTWGYLDAESETASPNGNSWREYINDLGWNAS